MLIVGRGTVLGGGGLGCCDGCGVGFHPSVVWWALPFQEEVVDNHQYSE